MDLRFGAYRLKRHERSLEGPNGPVDLSSRSFDILQALLDRPNELVSKDELFQAVWPGVAVEENTLQVHMSALRKALGPSLIVTVHGRGYKYTGPLPGGARQIAPAPAATADRKPIIAVLPFANLSGDPEQQYFSDGITEDIIARLARFRMLSVIAPHSSFAMRGRDEELAELRGRLSADHVLTGSVRKSGPRLRVSARLTDARTGNAVWAETYDRLLKDVFDVQDEVAALIASTLMGRVEAEAGLRRDRRQERDLTSYERVLQGIWHFKTLTIEGNDQAAALFEEALALSPDNAEALRWLASCYINRWFISHRRDHLQQSVELGRRSAERDPTSAQCHTAHGFAMIWAEGPERAAPIYRRAFQANAGDPNVLVEMALLNVYGGDLAQADELFRQADALNPLPPLWYAEFKSIRAFVAGDYAGALPGFAAIPECVFDTTYVMACLGHTGDAEAIARVLPRLKAQNWDLHSVAADEPFSHPEARERLAAGISKAMALVGA